MAGVKATERKARKIMKMDIAIWDRHDWQSGGAVNKVVHRKELRRELSNSNIHKIPDFYYFIFEDGNFHTLNEALEDINRFESKNPSFNEKAQETYDQYRDAGGKTWVLT